jgi:integrase
MPMMRDRSASDGDAKARRPRARGQNEGSIYQRREKHRKGEPVAESRETLGAFLDHWLEHVIKPNRKPKTHASYAQQVRTHIKPALGEIQLRKLRVEDVERFISDKRESKLSARTVQYLHAILRGALNRAVRLQKLGRNVAALVETPKVTRKEIQPLSAEQARALLEASKTYRVAPILLVQTALALRPGETLGLRWSDIDFEAKTLRVRQQLQRVNKAFIFVEPKTERSKKPIALPSLIVDTLKARRTEQARERLLAGRRWRETDLVFTSRIGTPLFDRNVTRDFKLMLGKAGIPSSTRLYDLRHTCATLLIAQGVHPRVVMETLRHSQYKLTMDLYSHVMPDLQREAASAMDVALKGKG